MSWLNRIFDGTAPYHPTLVLCHSPASIALVRREIARRGGVVGITVTSPLGLARAVGDVLDVDGPQDAGDSGLAAPKEPSGVLWDEVKDRRGLRRRLLEHVERVRLLEVPASELDERLADLAGQDFVESTGNRALKALLARARQSRGIGPEPSRSRVRLGTGHDFDRVLAIGFGDDDSGLPTPPGPIGFHRDLLHALGAEHLAAPVCREGPLDLEAIPASDVVAEARWVAAVIARYLDGEGSLGTTPDAAGQEARVNASRGHQPGGDGRREAGGVGPDRPPAPEAAGPGEAGRVLVLVPGRDDADRIRAALARSGIRATDDGARPLTEHGLAALLYRLLPWFAGEPDPEIDGDTLRRLLQSRLLEQKWPREAKKTLDAGLLERIREVGANEAERDSAEAPESTDPAEVRALAARDDADLLYLSRRQIPRVLRRSNLVKAPLTRWMAALKHLAGDDSQPPAGRRHALLILGRLAWLESSRQSVEGPPTLGCLLRFLQGFGIKTLSGGFDAVAAAIQRALGDHAALPATDDDLDDVLGGAVASGELHQGVVLLTYAEYDGRDADLLLATGLHAKGIGQHPQPDPFLESAELLRLGVYQGEAWLDFVEGQLVAAVRRSARALGAVARFDASGRAVAPHLYLGARSNDMASAPLKLRLLQDPSLQVTSYGLRLASPETSDLASLQRRLEPVPVSLPAGPGNDESRHAALMASVEWIRAGSHVEGYRPRQELPEEPTLLDYRERHDSAIPEWAAVYMGDARGIALAGLRPDANLSATAAIEPMTHCPYQLFGKVVLGLRQPEELTEELDAREIGTAAHEALRLLGPDSRWRPSSEQLESARRDLAAELTRLTGEAVKDRQASTAGLAQAKQGVLDRWSKHWAGYVANRVTPIEGEAEFEKQALDEVKHEPAMASALDWLETSIDALPRPWCTKERRKDLLGLLRLAGKARAMGDDPWSDAVLKSSGLTGPGRAAVRQTLDEDPLGSGSKLSTWLDSLAKSYGKALRFHRAWGGPISTGVAEWPFGKSRVNPDEPERYIPLGNLSCQVSGAIDLVRVTGTGEQQAIEVVDYKSRQWALSARDVLRGYLRGILPQVPLYALVLEKAIEDRQGPPGVLPTELPMTLSIDFLRRLENGKIDIRANDGPGAGKNGIDLDAFELLLARLIELARQGDYRLIPHPDTCPLLAYRGHDYCYLAELCRFRRFAGTEAETGSEEQASTDTEEDAP